MKQVIRKGVGEIIVEEVPDPLVPAHHVLVRPVSSLISSGTETASLHTGSLASQVTESRVRTVLDVMKREGPAATIRETRAKLRDEYAVIGYSGAGIVGEVHGSVADIQVGDRVAYGGEGTGHAESIVTGRHLVAKIPDGVSFDHAAFATLGAIALNAIRTAQLGVGDRVAIIGLGLVGQLTAQLARVQGAQVMAIDLRPARVRLAIESGADFGLAGGDSLADQVRAITEGRGADVVIVCAASRSSGPTLTALEICRDRGQIVVVGAVALEFPWHQAYLKEIRVLMARAYGPGSYDPGYERQAVDYPFAYVRWTENRNMEEVLRLIARGQLKLDALISHRLPLERAAEAYAQIMDPAAETLGVILQYSDPGGSARRKTAVARSGQANRPAPDRKAGNEIGVALVGPGVLSKWAHVPALNKIPHTRLVAVHSSSGARGKGVATRYGCDYCTTELDRILEDPAVHAVLITSRNQFHAPQALQALRAGKHVFVEKPMAITEAQCQDLVSAVRQSGLVLTVGFNRRFSPFYIPFKEKLASRTAPAVVHCRVNSPGISGDYWMADPAIGGAILGEACHFVDLMSWMLAAEPTQVSAYTLPAAMKDPVGANNLVASFLFADGSIGNLTYSTIGSKTSQGELVEAFQPGLGLTSQNFRRLSINGRISRTTSSWLPKKGYERQLVAFIDAIRHGTSPPVTVIDGVRASVACIRALESARSGAPRSIDLQEYLSA
jgi:predicted dehydrogenase/threonine dehydrogenase-like Zn-dependent dehydrogenase